MIIKFLQALIKVHKLQSKFRDLPIIIYMSRKKAPVDSIKHFLAKESRAEKKNAMTSVSQSKSLMYEQTENFHNLSEEAKSIQHGQSTFQNNIVPETQVYTDEMSPDENGHNYDEELMNQIEMEIYESNLNDDIQNDFLQKISDEYEQTNDIEQPPSKIKSPNKVNNKGSEKIINTWKSDAKIQKPSKQSEKVTEQEATQITGDSEEEQLIIPKKKEPIALSAKQKTQKIPPTYNPIKKNKNELFRQKTLKTPKKLDNTRKNPLNSDKKTEPVRQKPCTATKPPQPSKKLKQDQSNLSPKLVNFTVNIKLLNSKERVERVVKCLDTNRIKDKSEAKFLVVLEESKDYKIMKNDEMLYFYKDAIVDYYQAIHFS